MQNLDSSAGVLDRLLDEAEAGIAARPSRLLPSLARRAGRLDAVRLDDYGNGTRACVEVRLRDRRRGQARTSAIGDQEWGGLSRVPIDKAMHAASMKSGTISSRTTTETHGAAMHERWIAGRMNEVEISSIRRVVDWAAASKARQSPSGSRISTCPNPSKPPPGPPSIAAAAATTATGIAECASSARRFEQTLSGSDRAHDHERHQRRTDAGAVIDGQPRRQSDRLRSLFRFVSQLDRRLRRKWLPWIHASFVCHRCQSRCQCHHAVRARRSGQQPVESVRRGRSIADSSATWPNWRPSEAYCSSATRSITRSVTMGPSTARRSFIHVLLIDRVWRAMA